MPVSVKATASDVDMGVTGERDTHAELHRARLGNGGGAPSDAKAYARRVQPVG